MNLLLIPGDILTKTGSSSGKVPDQWDEDQTNQMRTKS